MSTPPLCPHHGHDPDPENRGKRESGNNVDDPVPFPPTTRGLNDVVNRSEIVDPVADAVDRETVPLDLVHIRVALETAHHRVVRGRMVVAEGRDMATHHLIALVVADIEAMDTVAVDGLAVDFEEEEVADVMDREEVAGPATRERILQHLEYWAVSD